MSATRRQALQAGAAGGVALWLANGPGVAFGATTPVVIDAPYLHRSAYADLAGATFRVQGTGPLRLEAVADLADAGARGLEGSDIAFALLFSGSATTPLAQGVQPLFLPDGSPASLFLVPVGDPGARRLYEVVVDRSVRIAGAYTPRPAGAAAPAAAVAAPAPTPAEPAHHAAAPEHRYAFLRAVSVRRGRPGVQVRLRLARTPRMRAVSVRLARNGVVYARGRVPVSAAGRRAHGGLRLLHALPRGRYDLVVEGTDRKGVKTAVRRSVTIR